MSRKPFTTLHPSPSTLHRRRIRRFSLPPTRLGRYLAFSRIFFRFGRDYGIVCGLLSDVSVRQAGLYRLAERHRSVKAAVIHQGWFLTYDHVLHCSLTKVELA